jgi:hypothetical protein
MHFNLIYILLFTSAATAASTGLSVSKNGLCGGSTGLTCTGSKFGYVPTDGGEHTNQKKELLFRARILWLLKFILRVYVPIRLWILLGRHGQGID